MKRFRGVRLFAMLALALLGMSVGAARSEAQGNCRENPWWDNWNPGLTTYNYYTYAFGSYEDNQGGTLQFTWGYTYQGTAVYWYDNGGNFLGTGSYSARCTYTNASGNKNAPSPCNITSDLVECSFSPSYSSWADDLSHISPPSNWASAKLVFEINYVLALSDLSGSYVLLGAVGTDYSPGVYVYR